MNAAACGYWPRDKVLRFVAWAALLVVGLFAWEASASTRIVATPTGIGRNGDAFGATVAMRGDTAAAGAPLTQVGLYADSGIVEIFRAGDAGWTSEAILHADEPAANARFGSLLALGQDLIVVMAGPIGPTSQIYTFVRSGTHWSRSDVFSVPAPSAISLSATTLVIATWPAAFVYQRSGAGWTQQAELPADLGAGERIDGVAIDGDIIALIGSTGSSIMRDASVHFLSRSGIGWIREDTFELGTMELGQTMASVSAQTAIVGRLNGDGTDATVRAFVRDNGAWSDQGLLDAGAPYTGLSLALEGDRAIVGSRNDDVLGHGAAGTAYLFTRSGGVWTRDAHIYDPDTGDYFYGFGSAVALSGDSVLVGSPNANTDAGAAGKATVFTLDSGTWNVVANFDDGSARADEEFGAGVDLSGPTLLVSAPAARGIDAHSGGAAYVFDRTGADWTQQARLVPPLGSELFFGAAVALDADTAVISAFDEATIGTAFVHVRDGSAWPLEAQLTADTADVTHFGWSMDLNGDVLAVGAPNMLDENPGAGAAYVFERAASVWSAAVPIQPADGAVGDRFGYSLKMSADTLIVGAPGADAGIESRAGAVYVYTHNASGWELQARLLAPVPAHDAGFGLSVAVKGETALVGAGTGVPFGDGHGAAYVFTRNGGTWSWQATLTPEWPNTVPSSFGQSVALSSDQSLAMVGTPYGTSGSPMPGTVYVFARTGAEWTPASPLYGSPPPEQFPVMDQFGLSMAWSGDELVVGAPGDGDGGAAYLVPFADSVFISGFDPVL